MTFEELNKMLDNKDLKKCKQCKRTEIYQIHAPSIKVWDRDGGSRAKTGYFATIINQVSQNGLCAECQETMKIKHFLGWIFRYCPYGGKCPPRYPFNNNEGGGGC